MPVLLTGKVFNDLSHKGIYALDALGIPYISLTLMGPDAMQLTTQTDAVGTYTFSGLNLPGDYTLLETSLLENIEHMPSSSTQPIGMNGSTTTRCYHFEITPEQILEDASINDLNFGHDLSDPFSDIELAYFLNAKEHTLNTLNLITGASSSLMSIHLESPYTLLAFNPLDYFIYGSILDSGKILRLSSDGIAVTYPITYLPHKTFKVGNVNSKGHLYLFEPLEHIFYVVDINQASSTYMHLLDPHNDFKSASSEVGALVNPLDICSGCFNPHNDLFYTIDTSGQLVLLDILHNEITYRTTSGTPLDPCHTIFCDCDDYLYCLFENTSSIYRIQVVDDSTLTEIFTTSSLSLSGGIRCYNAPTYIELGSAPDSSFQNGPLNYTTALSHNGPRHGATNILYFDQEAVEDFKPRELSIVEKTYSLTLPIINQTEKTAYLYAWIDFNRNGIFEPHEGIKPLSIPTTTEESLPFTILFDMPNDELISLGETYIRLRLTTDILLSTPSKVLDDSRSLGPASDGQILDLPLTLEAPSPVTIEPPPLFCEINQTTSGVFEAYDPCESPLEYCITKPPQHGLAHIHPQTGKWDYKPYEHFVGSDTFVISATSPRSHLSTETPLSLTVQKADLKISTTPLTLECLVGDTITYTTTIENIGTLPLTDLVYTHALPLEVSFVPTSVHINKVRDRTARPEHGINIHKLLPSEICIVSFQILLAKPLEVLSTFGIVSGSYAIASRYATYSQEASPVKVYIRSPKLLVAFDSHLTKAFIKDTLEYTIQLTNTGDVPLEEIKLLLALPPELQYSNHLTLMHNPLSEDLCSGYTIPQLMPKDSMTLSFTAEVIASSSHESIEAMLFTSYAYKLSGELRHLKDLSTSASLNICTPNLKLTPTFSKPSISLGESFNYTLMVSNQSNFLVQETLIKNALPKEVQILDISCNHNPIPNTLDEGISLGEIKPLSTLELTLKLKLTHMPSDKVLHFPNAMGIFHLLHDYSAPCKIIYEESSTPLPLPITDIALQVEKSVSNLEASIGEVITYTITLTNNGTIPLLQVTVRDLLCPELKFVPKSILLNNTALPHMSLMSGIVIESLNPGETKMLSFDCSILDRGNGILENTCSVYYTYKPPHSTYVKSGSTTSPPCPLTVRKANLELLGKVNQSLAFLEDELTYTIEVVNNGDMDVFNVFINHQIDACELLDGSFKINSLAIHSVDLLSPIHIGNIPKEESLFISYKVKVIGPCHYQDSLANKISLSFSYTTMDGHIKYDQSSLLDLSLPLALSTFKQLSLDNFLEIPCHDPDMEMINTMGGQIALLKHYIINSPKGISLEGQKLSGKKLIVHALLELNVEYVGANPEQSIHSAYYTIPFSTFIILPKECPSHTLLHIDATIENISFKVLSNRSFFTNASLLLVARIK